MTTTVSNARQSGRSMDEDRLHPDEREILQVFRESPLIPSPRELRSRLPEMDHVAAHVAVCNLVVSGYVAFSPEGYRLIEPE